MRSFSPSGVRELLLKLQIIIPNFAEEDFIEYIVDEFSYRIYLFIGENKEFLKDCISVSLFAYKVHLLEIEKIDFNLSVNLVDKSLFFDSKAEFFTDWEESLPNQINLKNISLDKFEEWLKNISEYNKTIWLTILEQIFIKKLYNSVKEKIANNTINIINSKKLGRVISNFQPDNRGEFLLLANKDVQEKYLAKCFLLDKDMKIYNISKTKILYLE